MIDMDKTYSTKLTKLLLAEQQKIIDDLTESFKAFQPMMYAVDKFPRATPSFNITRTDDKITVTTTITYDLKR